MIRHKDEGRDSDALARRGRSQRLEKFGLEIKNLQRSRSVRLADWLEATA